jgi:hypothetical protein
MNLQKIARIGLRLAGLALLVIGRSKILHFESFLDSLDGYLVFPDVLLEPAGVFLVGVELVVALGLCIPKFQRMAALGLIGLMLLFAVAIGSSLLNGMSIDCGCFGALAGPSKISWLMVARDLAIALTAGIALAVISPAKEVRSGINAFLASHFTTLFAATVFFIMAASLIWLIQNNRLLSLRLEAYVPIQQLLKPGDSLPPLEAKRVGGGEEEITFSGNQKMVLLIFSPQCPHCQEAIQWWSGEIERHRLENNPLKVIGVSVLPEVPQEFMDRYHVSFPIYIPDSMRKFNKSFPARTVPMTIFINPPGKVAFTFEGYPPQRTEF